MKIFNKLLILLFLTAPFYSAAQRNCDFKIDTTKVLLNKNVAKFITKLKENTFTTYYNVKEIPANVKSTLDCLSDSFSIVNPDQEYACCCTSSKELPERQLISLFKSKDVLALFYVTGGAATTAHIVLIHFSNYQILDFWAGHSLDNLKSTEDVVKYLQVNEKKRRKLGGDILYF